MSFIIVPTPADRASVIMLDHLHGIIDQANDLSALLVSVDALPTLLVADALRVLCRLDHDLTDLVERIGASGP